MAIRKRTLFLFLLFGGLTPLLALASMAISIILPSVVISFYGWLNSQPEDIVAFAAAVAEPVALVGTVAFSLWLSLKKQKDVTSFAWSLYTGLCSALGLIFGAFWTGDLDSWAISALILIPAATLIFWKLRTKKTV
jgi:hypothetical protein